MLSYQHEFHAGNTADVFKHCALTYILDSLCKKDKPFTVIDSHSGAGRFHLDDDRSLKTGEAENGIKTVFAQCNVSANEQSPLLERYLSLEKPYLERNLYAGSPELERLIMRGNDKLFLVEKHPGAVESLRTNMKMPLLTYGGTVAATEAPVAATNATISATELPLTTASTPLASTTTDTVTEARAPVSITIREGDSYEALAALTPPLVKRGLVITDPSYEDESDYRAVTNSLKLVHKKWNTAIIELWYPLLTRKQNLLSQMLIALEDDAKLSVNPSDWFKVELVTQNPDELQEAEGSHMYGSGMFVMNPPWMMKEEMDKVVALLTKTFSAKIK